MVICYFLFAQVVVKNSLETNVLYILRVDFLLEYFLFLGYCVWFILVSSSSHSHLKKSLSLLYE